MGSSPKLGFGWVWVPAHGFKSQSGKWFHPNPIPSRQRGQSHGANEVPVIPAASSLWGANGRDQPTVLKTLLLSSPQGSRTAPAPSLLPPPGLSQLVSRESPYLLGFGILFPTGHLSICWVTELAPPLTVHNLGWSSSFPSDLVSPSVKWAMCFM